MKMNIDLKNHNGRGINPGERFKQVISILKKADPNLLLLPLPKSSTDTIIHQIPHIPTQTPDLKNYLKYKMGNYQVECIFRIRTIYTIYFLKNRPGTLEKLGRLQVYIRHTKLETVKSKVIATLYKSHSFFTQ